MNQIFLEFIEAYENKKNSVNYYLLFYCKQTFFRLIFVLLENHQLLFRRNIQFNMIDDEYKNKVRG